MRYGKLLLVIVLLMGCSNSVDYDQQGNVATNDDFYTSPVQRSVGYYRDPRTNLCFAAWLSAHQGGLALVSCSDSLVARQLKEMAP